LVTLSKKKGQDIIPLDESEYTGFEIHELSSCDGFSETIKVMIRLLNTLKTENPHGHK